MAEEPAAPAEAAQPGIAQDLRVINLHGGGSGKAPTVSTSCVSLPPAASLRTSRLPVRWYQPLHSFGVPARKPLTADLQTPERPFYYWGTRHEIAATREQHSHLRQPLCKHTELSQTAHNAILALRADIMLMRQTWCLFRPSLRRQTGISVISASGQNRLQVENVEWQQRLNCRLSSRLRAP